MIPALALALFVLYVGLAFVRRSLVQRRATGSTGFFGLSGRPGSLPWLGGALFVVALALGAAAPLVRLAGLAAPLVALPPFVASAGLALAALGLVLALAAQGAMGIAWRIGVRETERTSLVTSGAFAIVRNPFFSATMLFALGLSLALADALSLAAFALLVAAVELQVRLVEEPYLARVHGEAYARYAARVGRFVPGVGKLRPAAAAPARAARP